MSPSVVPGTPRWAVVAAWGTIAAVVPSAVWRIAVGLGVPLGWTDEQLRAQQMPGAGTWYVLGLSLVSLVAAALTLGLVQPWGERVPAAVPWVGGRRVPVRAAVAGAGLGACTVIAITAISVARWEQVSGFAGRGSSPGALLMIACYAPALAWGPLLLAVTWAYWRRRTGG